LVRVELLNYLWSEGVLWKQEEGGGGDQLLSVTLALLRSVFIIDKWLPNFDLKNVISTSIQVFSWKRNGPNSPDFEREK
jgi:hypothetical protein